MAKNSLFNFMERLILKFKAEGRQRAAERYLSALNSFKSFRRQEDISFRHLSAEILKTYQEYLILRGLTLNTVSFYMRILRAACNKAAAKGFRLSDRPFSFVFTGIAKTRKRALPVRIIKNLRNLDLTTLPKLDYARDMFMMSFYLRGMSLVDMAFLRKENLKNGYLSYCRRKTGRMLQIRWTSEMQQIIDKYNTVSTGYLLPILRKESGDMRRRYLYESAAINRYLKNLSEMAGSPASFTLYAARHSWASAAKLKGIPLHVISEAMGHDSETTTRIYLATLSSLAVDRANSMVIRALG